jgi:hypothetical protein
VTLSETAAGWAATALLAAVGALFTVMGATRARAAEVELEAPHAVPASRNGQRRRAQAVGRQYAGWAVLASVVTIASAMPSAIVLRHIDLQASVSWQRCGLVAVGFVWLVVALRLWVRALKLMRASWLD